MIFYVRVLAFFSHKQCEYVYLGWLSPGLYIVDEEEKSVLDVWACIVISFSVLPVRPCWTWNTEKLFIYLSKSAHGELNLKQTAYIVGLTLALPSLVSADGAYWDLAGSGPHVGHVKAHP